MSDAGRHDQDELGPTERREIAEASLARQLEWIRAVENKLAIVVAVDAAMLAILAARHPMGQGLFSVPTVWVLLGSALPLLSIVRCAKASLPRVKASNVSLLFFGTISDYSREDYTKRFGALRASDYLKDLLAQVHRNAEIARDKYKLIAGAMTALMLGIPVWLIAIVAI